MVSALSYIFIFVELRPPLNTWISDLNSSFFWNLVSLMIAPYVHVQADIHCSWATQHIKTVSCDWQLRCWHPSTIMPYGTNSLKYKRGKNKGAYGKKGESNGKLPLRTCPGCSISETSCRTGLWFLPNQPKGWIPIIIIIIWQNPIFFSVILRPLRTTASSLLRYLVHVWHITVSRLQWRSDEFIAETSTW